MEGDKWVDISKSQLAAIRRVAIEECAHIAELRQTVFGGEPTTRNEQQIVEHIVAAIRRLQQP